MNRQEIESQALKIMRKFSGSWYDPETGELQGAARAAFKAAALDVLILLLEWCGKDEILRDELQLELMRKQDLMRRGLTYGENGKVQKTWQNTKVLLEIEGVTCRYNQLKNIVEWSVPRYNTISQDAVVPDLDSILIRKGYTLSARALRDHVCAMSEETKYHPVQDYLNGLRDKWDGQDYVGELFSCFQLDPNYTLDCDFLKLLFTKWLITAARLAFNTGKEAAQGLLILSGPQGIGKSRFIYSLLPDISWGAMGRTISRDKDTIIHTTGYWIVELGEYCNDVNTLDRMKRFVTDPVDEYRRPYAKNSEKVPRTTTFYATTNNTEFLMDRTGERRNWVIPLVDILPSPVNPDDLWAQVMHLAYKEEVRPWLRVDEIMRLNAMNEAYKVRGRFEEQLLEELDWEAPREQWLLTTPTILCRALTMDTRENAQVGRALQALVAQGVEDMGRVRVAGKQVRAYRMPPFREPAGGQLGQRNADLRAGNARFVEK